jgi:hypothetical protein
VVLIPIILGVLLCSKHRDPVLENLNQDEHPLKFLYPLALKLYGLVEKSGHRDIFGATDVLREIYVDEKPEVSLKKQGCKCIASVLAVLAATAFICFAYSNSKENLLLDGNHLKRHHAGGGNQKYNIIMKSEFTEKVLMDIEVSEQKLQGEEFEKLKTDAGYYLDKEVLRNNKSAECVREKLVLVDTIPGTAVTVKWDNDNSWFMSLDGTLKNEDYEDPVTVRLHAVLTYFETSWDHYLDIIIYPPLVSEEELFLQTLKKKLSELDTETQTEEYLDLPDSVEGRSIDWEEEEDNTVRNFLLLGLLAAGIIIPAQKQDIKKKQKKRTDQMMRDYPDIISKFIMLTTAGMTCRGAWDKICRDYLRTKDSKGEEDKKEKGKKTIKPKNKKSEKDIRYAYEEMLISNNEMQLGIPEVKVYERFGARSSVPAYNRFGNMLARNIRRGSAGIIELLESEAKESFAERRENVRKKGEETGTKLLIPMFGMLILVIAIVVVPAFSSFSF